MRLTRYDYGRDIYVIPPEAPEGVSAIQALGRLEDRDEPCHSAMTWYVTSAAARLQKIMSSVLTVVRDLSKRMMPMSWAKGETLTTKDILEYRPTEKDHDEYRGRAMSDELIEARLKAFWSVVKPWPKLKALPRKVVNTLYVLQIDKGSWDRIIVNYPDDYETVYEIREGKSEKS